MIQIKRFLVDQQGDNKISFEYYALALLEEVANPKFSRERFTIRYLYKEV